MRSRRLSALRFGFIALAAGAFAAAWGTAGCASGVTAAQLGVLQPFPITGGTGGTTGGATAGGQSSFFTQGQRVNVDPCSEPLERKFITISMRNLAEGAFVHYFFVAVAFVNSETYPNGNVCEDDIALYTSAGYTEIPAGQFQGFGDYCIQGPALVYFHRAGRFAEPGGQLASAIAPPQGTSPTFDPFFSSAGGRLPVPAAIVFHNPGSGDGAALLTRPYPDACVAVNVGPVTARCQQDAFYYVDENDRLLGSFTLGIGSGRRVPSEIQGTGCQCTGFSNSAQELAPSGTSASNAFCNEFLRGGRIEYAFLREDVTPAFPQLVWRVRDASGGLVHDFDLRAGIP